MNKLKFIVITPLLTLTMVCAPVIWTPTTGSFISSKIGVSCKTPPGWYQIAPPKVVVFTRNGTGLETVMLQSYRWNDTLWTKKKQVRKDHLLHELVWQYLTNYISAGSIYNLRILSDSIVLIDSVPSACVDFSCKNADELPLHGVMTCTPLHTRVLFTEYLAAERYYYDKSLKVYNSLISTIRLDSKERINAVSEIHAKKEAREPGR